MSAGAPSTFSRPAAPQAPRRRPTAEERIRAIWVLARRMVHAGCAVAIGLLVSNAVLAPWAGEAWNAISLFFGWTGTVFGGFLVLAIGLVRLRETGPYPLAGWIVALGLTWSLVGPVREASTRAAWETRRAELDALVPDAVWAAETLEPDQPWSDEWKAARRRAIDLGLHDLQVDDGGRVRFTAAEGPVRELAYQWFDPDGVRPPLAERIGHRTFRREPLGGGWWLVEVR